MALIHWEPVRELGTLQSEMNRLFSTFFEPGAAAPDAPARRWTPAMDLVEHEDDYVLRADLPGLTEQDVSIDFENHVLTVSGHRRAEHEGKDSGYYRVERSFGAFSRSLTLPEGVDPTAIRARFEHGVLEIRVPKPAQRKPHRVSIEVGGGDAAAVETTAQDTASPAAAEPALAGNGASATG